MDPLSPPSIVVIGSSNTDMVVKVPHLPAHGETVLGGRFIMAAGGKGANQAVAAARLGANVTFVARVGSDSFGRAAKDAFSSEGICADWISLDPEEASGVALIFVDDHGENCIAVAPGANQSLSPDDILRAKSAIQHASVAVLQLEVPIETVMIAAQTARENGLTVVLNPAPAMPVPDGLLNLVDVLIPNRNELEQLTGGGGTIEDQARRLRSNGVGAVVVTLGGEGALIVDDEGITAVPACIVNAVDTTAAGDAFTGAIAVSIAEGKPLADAARFASAAAAISVTRLGAQPSLPMRAEVDEFLNRG